MDKPRFVYVTYIDTTPEKLWQALTGGDFTFQYWAGRRLESDWRPGSPVRLVREDGGMDVQGEVLRAEPPRLLSYTFGAPYVGGRPPEPPSRVTFEITPIMGKVKLSLLHEDLLDRKMLEGVSQGWPAILAGLKSLLESGRVLFPQWRTPEQMHAV